MKISHNCLVYVLTTLIVASVLSDQNVVIATDRNRRSPESILDIMNTEEIEKLIAQRRRNSTGNFSSRTINVSSNPQNLFFLENALNDDLSELPTAPNRSRESANGRSTNKQQHHHHHHQHHHQQQQQQQQQQGRQQKHRSHHHKSSGQQVSREELEYGGLNNQGDGSSMLLPYNDTSYSSDPTPDPMIALHRMRGDKLLKSSKNALYITRKEYLNKDWCKTEPLIQRIREPGCIEQPFINRFCYGQCNSFYIPKSPKRRRNHSQSRHHQGDHLEDVDLTGAAFQSCGFCRPKKYTWVTVTLRCPSLIPPIRRKRVQRIRQCKCMAKPLD